MKRLLPLTIALFAGAVLAQTPSPTTTPRLDARQENQAQRIEQGVASGQLTGKEAARLEKGQERLQKMEDKAAADGKVTAKERTRLAHQADKQSHMIAREKHDRQRDMNHDGKRDRTAHREGRRDGKRR